MTSTATSISATDRVTFIGGGNMARSLIAGLRKQGVEASRLAVAEPVRELREALAADFGLRVAEHGRELVSSSDVLVLAVKPQVMESVCRELAPGLTERTVVLSIAAGVTCEKLSAWLGSSKVVRSMPNTPALLGAGASGLFAPAGVDAAQRAQAEQVLGAAGVTVWIDNERLMDVVTALSGSGPAYFFLLVEALVDAAVAQGLPRPAAELLARHTAFGSARMLVESADEAAELRRRVTSPGGTTHAAVSRFQADGFESSVAAAVAAAVARGRELAGG